MESSLDINDLTLTESFTYHSFFNQLESLSKSELVDLIIKMKLVSKYNSKNLVANKLMGSDLNLISLDLKSIQEFKVTNFDLLSTEMMMKGEIKDTLAQCKLEDLYQCCHYLIVELILSKRIVQLLLD